MYKMKVLGVFFIVFLAAVHADFKLEKDPPEPIVRPSGGHVDVGANIRDIVKNSPNHLDGSIYAKVPLQKELPVGIGGGLQYRNDRGHGVYANVDHIPKINTRVDVGATYRIHETPRTKVDLVGGAYKSFGPYGDPWGVQGGVRINF